MVQSIAAQLAQNENLIKANKLAGNQNSGQISFGQVLENKQVDCPYSYLAKDGVINYNGVTLVCDPQTNSICLGDMSNEKEVLTINLPSGGNLKVNINNFGDISRAAGMFTPEDLNAIMRAISQYNHCVRKQNEIEEVEANAAEKVLE